MFSLHDFTKQMCLMKAALAKILNISLSPFSASYTSGVLWDMETQWYGHGPSILNNLINKNCYIRIFLQLLCSQLSIFYAESKIHLVFLHTKTTSWTGIIGQLPLPPDLAATTGKLCWDTAGKSAFHPQWQYVWEIFCHASFSPSL